MKSIFFSFFSPPSLILFYSSTSLAARAYARLLCRRRGTSVQPPPPPLTMSVSARPQPILPMPCRRRRLRLAPLDLPPIPRASHSRRSCLPATKPHASSPSLAPPRRCCPCLPVAVRCLASWPFAPFPPPQLTLFVVALRHHRTTPWRETESRPTR